MERGASTGSDVFELERDRELGGSGTERDTSGFQQSSSCLAQQSTTSGTGCEGRSARASSQSPVGRRQPAGLTATRSRTPWTPPCSTDVLHGLFSSTRRQALPRLHNTRLTRTSGFCHNDSPARRCQRQLSEQCFYTHDYERRRSEHGSVHARDLGLKDPATWTRSSTPSTSRSSAASCDSLECLEASCDSGMFGSIM